jgi:succinoglycan biosynthesis protein ExoA
MSQTPASPETEHAHEHEHATFEGTFVSVIVPVRNEEGYISGCMQALAQQDYPREGYEVIVLDGESTDGTAREAAEAAAMFGAPDIFLTNRLRTTATGLNLGLTIARGDVIVRVDGHTQVDPHFISESVRVLEETGADAVGGPIRTKGRGRVATAIGLAMSSPFGVGDAAFRHSGREQWTDSVAFAAYRRDVFERIGGFEPDILQGEDDEFNYRLRDAGGKILLTPRISSVYYARGSYGELARQYWNYGLAKAKVLERHPRRLRWRHFVPSALVLTLVSCAVLTPLDRRFAALFSLTSNTYAAATVIASVRIASRGHWKFLPLLPPAFACIHLPAGAGLIVGFARRLLAAFRK